MFNLSSTESFIVVDLNINPDPEETQPHSTPIPNFQTIDSKKTNESEIPEEKVEKQFDPCNDNPCQNEGVCQVKDGQVVCLCLKDFAGDHCESKLGHNSSYSAASIFRSSILWSVFSLAKTQQQLQRSSLIHLSEFLLSCSLIFLRLSNASDSLW